MSKSNLVSHIHEPRTATAVLVLADGSVFHGFGVGQEGETVGEVCFNTSMTGYQESLTDPSFAGQMITFTFPHIGNVGFNDEDIETSGIAANGLIIKADITDQANWRAAGHLDEWLKERELVGISGIDTRRLTHVIRESGAPNGIIAHNKDGKFDLEDLKKKAAEWPGLEGMDLAIKVTCKEPYKWSETSWNIKEGFGEQTEPKRHIVAVDYGVKRNILRCLADHGCDITVVPANSSFDDIMSHNPDGIFLANGPGDPAATGEYAVPVIKQCIESGVPTFGICLGHQMLALAVGAETMKMQQGHRGANQPVKDLTTGRVEITSQNHGFVVKRESLPDGVTETHKSLFDGVVEGIALDGKPVFSVQYHPEANPGPQDSYYLFKRFVDMVDANA
ncbi:glutamine-hydrolyzing carbamoyl-phosphate synthase small subunit [Sneathiella sp. P13V-1]|uniref:glutamine-hydrolyzing carbamoyl-phosphate synthase small subunit n=1 Tax=Sneathiella sp. P13V-1 TaxID=2697366 RepID=UPI00187B844B|nr:glutamine-hydrolyzing carbamoyl-phosphate synthase small subunit [Sneathiella sp. P13V-1]MBE7638030.1 glutamine-hydrolyzing carbamoyl-phosphate synthase small subunit [Sneathiella sp. P13V-1]